MCWSLSPAGRQSGADAGRVQELGGKLTSWFKKSCEDKTVCLSWQRLRRESARTTQGCLAPWVLGGDGRRDPALDRGDVSATGSARAGPQRNVEHSRHLATQRLFERETFPVIAQISFRLPCASVAQAVKHRACPPLPALKWRSRCVRERERESVCVLLVRL